MSGSDNSGRTVSVTMIDIGVIIQFPNIQPVSGSSKADTSVTVMIQVIKKLFHCRIVIPNDLSVPVQLVQRIDHADSMVSLKISDKLLNILHHQRWSNGFQCPVFMLCTPDITVPFADKAFHISKHCHTCSGVISFHSPAKSLISCTDIGGIVHQIGTHGISACSKHIIYGIIACVKFCLIRKIRTNCDSFCF